MTSSENLVSLVRELQRLGWETQWVEFKVDNAKPDEIGEYISALANGPPAPAGRLATWSGASTTNITPSWEQSLTRSRPKSGTRNSKAGSFGLTDAYKTSRLIADAVEVGLIRLANPDAGGKLASYVPHWA